MSRRALPAHSGSCSDRCVRRLLVSGALLVVSCQLVTGIDGYTPGVATSADGGRAGAGGGTAGAGGGEGGGGGGPPVCEEPTCPPPCAACVEDTCAPEPPWSHPVECPLICNGRGACAFPGEVLTGGAYPQEGVQLPGDVAVDSEGAAIVVGAYTGTLAIGANAPPRTADPSVLGSSDLFLAKVDSDGGYVWADDWNPNNGFQTELGLRVEVDEGDDIYVSGAFNGNFGCGNLVAQGFDILLMRVFGASGSAAWCRKLGGLGDQSFASISLMPSQGGLIVAGTLTGTINFDGDLVGAGAGDSDIYVARLSEADGAIQGYGRFGNSDVQTLLDVDTTQSAGVPEILIGGAADGDLGLGSSLTTYPAAYVARLGQDLVPLSAELFAGNAQVEAVAYGDGRSYAVGTFAGSVTINGMTHDAESPRDMFVVQLDDQGQVADHAIFRGELGRLEALDTRVLLSLEVAADQGVYITGGYNTPGAFGAGGPPHLGASDGFVLKLTPELELQWITTFNSPGTETGVAAALSPLGRLVVAGAYDTPFEVHGVPLTAPPGDADPGSVFLFDLVP